MDRTRHSRHPCDARTALAATGSKEPETRHQTERATVSSEETTPRQRSLPDAVPACLHAIQDSPTAGVHLQAAKRDQPTGSEATSNSWRRPAATRRRGSEARRSKAACQVKRRVRQHARRRRHQARAMTQQPGSASDLHARGLAPGAEAAGESRKVGATRQGGCGSEARGAKGSPSSDGNGPGQGPGASACTLFSASESATGHAFGAWDGTQRSSNPVLQLLATDRGAEARAANRKRESVRRYPVTTSRRW
jgi:hypothetical protein